MRIKVEMIEKIKGNLGLRKQLMEVLDVSRTTMWSYLETNDDNLTKAAALKLIGDHYNITSEEILEDETKAA